jgi:hypothetical protein
MKLDLYQSTRKKYIILSCAVFAREVFHSAAKAKNIIDVKIIDQGLHDTGQEHMLSKIQLAMNEIDTKLYDAVLLGYGLCNNGLLGIKSNLPIVIPRAHDCIAILMGSKEKYQCIFDAFPGTFYRSSGWIEQGGYHLENSDSLTVKMGMETYEETVAKYGKENADYLFEALDSDLRNYSKLTYIDTGVFDDTEYIAEDKKFAESKNWEFEVIQGNTSIFEKMMNGEWDEEIFQVIPPGCTIGASYDEQIIKVENVKNTNS